MNHSITILKIGDLSHMPLLPTLSDVCSFALRNGSRLPMFLRSIVCGPSTVIDEIWKWNFAYSLENLFLRHQVTLAKYFKLAKSSEVRQTWVISSNRVLKANKLLISDSSVLPHCTLLPGRKTECGDDTVQPRVQYHEG